MKKMLAKHTGGGSAGQGPNSGGGPNKKKNASF